MKCKSIVSVIVAALCLSGMFVAIASEDLSSADARTSSDADPLPALDFANDPDVSAKVIQDANVGTWDNNTKTLTITDSFTIDATSAANGWAIYLPGDPGSTITFSANVAIEILMTALPDEAMGIRSEGNLTITSTNNSSLTLNIVLGTDGASSAVFSVGTMDIANCSLNVNIDSDAEKSMLHFILCANNAGADMSLKSATVKLNDKFDPNDESSHVDTNCIEASMLTVDDDSYLEIHTHATIPMALLNTGLTITNCKCFYSTGSDLTVPYAETYTGDTQEITNVLTDPQYNSVILTVPVGSIGFKISESGSTLECYGSSQDMLPDGSKLFDKKNFLYWVDAEGNQYTTETSFKEIVDAGIGELIAVWGESPSQSSNYEPIAIIAVMGLVIGMSVACFAIVLNRRP